MLILAELNFKTIVTENSQAIPDWKKANMDRIKESFIVNWEQKFEGKATHLCWNECKTFLHESAQKNVPMQKKR